AGKLSGGLRSGADALPRDEHVDGLRNFERRGQRPRGHVAKRSAHDFGQKKGRHGQITPASSWSYATSSDTVCRPPSTSRVTSTEPSPTTTFEAKVPWPQPVSAANIWPVWFESSSIACLPMMTIPGCSASTTPLS